MPSVLEAAMSKTGGTISASEVVHDDAMVVAYSKHDELQPEHEDINKTR